MNPTNNGCILVADDDGRYLRLIRVNLEASGYAVITVQDGQQAWRDGGQCGFQAELLTLLRLVYF